MINSNPRQIKSAKPLKKFVGTFDKSYLTNKQQDVEEFVNYMLSKCEILKQLTKFSVHSSFQCIKCKTITNNIDEMNVRYENLHYKSIQRILTTYENLPLIEKNCNHCQKDTNHAKKKTDFLLPNVLIVSLKRFVQIGDKIDKNCSEVWPSPILELGDEIYLLNAVIIHFGRTVDEGHYLTTLY